MAYPANKERNKKLLEMKEDGMSFREIANELNLHHSTVIETYKRWIGRKNESYT